jgi:hypothetical protein
MWASAKREGKYYNEASKRGEDAVDEGNGRKEKKKNEKEKKMNNK